MEKWSPRASTSVQNDNSNWPLVRLRNLLKQIHDPVPVNPDQTYRMAGVKWYGDGVFEREIVRGDGQSARSLAPLVPGRLVYNRLFGWKQAFALVEPTHSGLWVSNEFPQFQIEVGKVTPEFLLRSLVGERFASLCLDVSEGSTAVSRNRLKEAAFLELEVSLPPLQVQRSIVAAWTRDQAAAQALLAEADGLEEKARAAFADALGVAGASRSKPRRAMALNWVDIERWAVDAARGGASPGVAARGPFPSVQLGDVLTRIQYGTSEKANTEGRGVPVLRMGNIQDGALDFARLKHVQLPPADVARWALSQGDLLVNRTNSKDLVGKCAVFEAQGTYVFASYLIRLQLDGQKVLPAFVAEVLNGPIGRRQIDALSRQIIGQANINSVELKSLWIPLPPLEVQQRLVDDLELATSKASDLREQSRNLRAAAQDKLECQLRGQPPKEPA